MLPTVKHPVWNLSAIKTTAIAAVAALSLAAGSASPAQAWGKREQGFVAGVATSVIVGAIANDIKHKNRARQQQYYQEPRYQPAPQYYYQQPRYQPPRHYQAPRPVYAPQPAYNSLYNTAAARAFGSYSLTERMAIQRRLSAQGYYRSGIDGSFGPGTYNAVVAYARDTRQAGNLESTAGSYGVYDGLLY